MVFSLFIVITFICALWQSMGFNVRAGLFPWAIGFPVLALAIVQFVMDFLGKEGRRSEDSPGEAEIELPSDVVNRRTAGIFVWIVSYFVAIWLLGFSIAAPFCTFIQLKIGAKEKWLITLILSGAAWAFIFGVFDRLLHVPFPPGILFEWFR